MNSLDFIMVEPVKYGANAIYTIISDDGILSTVEELYRIALKYDIKITIAQAIMNISNLQRLQDIEKSNCIEFISHSFSHLNMGNDSIPASVLKYEILESKKYMQQNFITPQIAFVPPNNQLSKKAYSICENNFYAIRRWTREFNPLSPEPGIEPLNWFNLGCKGIGDVNNTEKRNKWIDECIQKKMVD